MHRILCLWLPQWPLQRLIAVRPELFGCPLLLRTAAPRGGQMVLACSAEALQAGVRPGMSLVEAQALRPRDSSGRRTQASSSAAWRVEAHDPEADCRALQRLAEWCERFSPIVGWEPVPPGSPPPPRGQERVFLDVTGVGALFGGEAELSRKLLCELVRRGYRAHAAVADSLGAAWAVASGLGEGKGEGKIGQSSGGERGEVGSSRYRIVPPGAKSAALAGLPVEALRLSSETLRWLHELGIDEVDPLWQLPRAALGCRFGSALLERLDQAEGRLAEPLLVHRAPPPFRAHQSLEHPLADRAALELVLRQLLAQVSQPMQTRGQGALRLVCGVDCGTRGQLRVQVNLFRPTADVPHLWELIQLQLEPQRLPGAVEHVRLDVELTARLEQEQGELFAVGRSAPARPLVWLLERLGSRLGNQRVVRPRLRCDAQPERAFRYEPVTARRRANRASAPLLPLPGQRPLWLWERPCPLEVLALAPDGPPLRFRHEQQEQQVTRHWGPERVETGWWRGRTVGRDYYRVETAASRQFWLFRRLADGQWFLHGVFD